MKSGRICAAVSLLLAAAMASAALGQSSASPGENPTAPAEDSGAPRDQPLFGADANDPLTAKGPNAPDKAEPVGGRGALGRRTPQVASAGAEPDPAADADAPSASNPDGSPADPPHFVSRPNETQLLRAYPGLALRMRKSGKAVIRCTVDVEGALGDCRLLSESPPGMGFGQASLGLAHWYRLSPPIADGRPVSGMVVVIPMKWLVG